MAYKTTCGHIEHAHANSTIAKTNTSDGYIIIIDVWSSCIHSNHGFSFSIIRHDIRQTCPPRLCITIRPVFLFREFWELYQVYIDSHIWIVFERLRGRLNKGGLNLVLSLLSRMIYVEVQMPLPRPPDAHPASMQYIPSNAKLGEAC